MELEPSSPLEPSPQRLSRPPALAVYLLAVLGGVAGIFAAVGQEMLQGASILLAGPIEEICKPIGLVMILDKKPHWLRNRVEVIFLAVVGAGVFATLENLLYVHVYHPAGSSTFVVFRYTVCSALHVVCTGIFGIGLAKTWKRIRARGGRFDVDECFWWYVAAAALHSLYNGTVMLLETFKVIRF